MSGSRLLRPNALFGSLAVMALVGLQACGQRDSGSADVQRDAHGGHHHDGLWNDGDFEQGNTANPNIPIGWAVNSNLNTGITGYNPSAPPQLLSQLGLAAGGWQHAPALGPNTTLGIFDPDLGAGQTFRYPRFGSFADVVNYGGTVQTGNNRASTTLQQSMVVSLNDVDPSDNQVHVRFAYAPVLELPAHQYASQTYYLVQLINTSRSNAVLYSAFSVAGQPGIPWNTTIGKNTGYTTQWIDWTLADITPAQGTINIGDTVQLSIVATGCLPGGHFGRVYVDGVGPQVPGPYISATGPTQAAINSNITYTLHYANGANTASKGTVVTIVTPQNTNVVSVPAGCVNTSGSIVGPATITCPIGTLSPQSYGNYSLTLQVGPNAPNVLNFATYTIAAIGYPPLLGAQVATKMGPVNAVDVTTTYNPIVTAANWSGTLNYSVVVASPNPNNLPAGSVNVYYPQAANVTTMTWTCTPAASCGNTSGTGTLNEYPYLPAGGSVTYAITATVQAGSGLGNTGSTFAANVVSNAVDVFPLNNVQYIGYNIGNPNTLTITSTGGGSVLSTPAGISCGSACTASYANGANVVLNAVPPAGGSFVSWTAGPCSASTNPNCSFTLSANTSATATFRAAPTTPAANSGTAMYALQGNLQYAQASNTFAQPLWAIVVDQNGTPVPGASVSFTVAGTNATISSTNPIVTNANGIAAATVVAGTTVAAAPYTVVASTVATAGTLNANFALTNVGPGATLTYQSGGGSTSDIQVAGINAWFRIPLTALLKDTNGNPVPNANVTFTPPATAASTTPLTPVTVTTDGKGNASTYIFANGTAGQFTMTASSPGVATGANFFLQNVGGTPAYMNYVSGSPQSVLASTSTQTNVFSQNLSVTIADASGDQLAGVTVTFTVNGNAITNANCTLSSPTAVTNAYGIASVTATAGQGFGSYTVTAASTSGTTSPAVMTFTLTNDGTQVLSEISGSPQTTPVTTAFPTSFSVKLTDTSGNAITNTPVTFTAPAAGAAVTFSSGIATITTNTNGSGIATVAGNANTVSGNYNITVTSAAVTRPLLLNVTNTPSAANSLIIPSTGSGNNQNANVNTAFAAPIAVKVIDKWGNGVSGQAVTFTATPASGATWTFTANPVVTTDANGLASLVVTANSIANPTTAWTVTATNATLPAGVTLSLKNLAGPPAVLTATAGSPQTGTVASTLTGMTGTVKDANNNVIGNAPITFTVAPTTGPGASLVTSPVLSNGSGVFSFSLNTNTVAGTYTFTAVSGTANNSAATWTFTNVAGAANIITLAPTNNGNSQTAVVFKQYTNPLVVQITDRYGNPVTGTSVQFSVTPAANGASGAFTPSNGTVLSGAGGLAAVTFTANKIADDTSNPTFTVTATTTFGTANFTLANTPDVPASISVSPTTSTSAPLYGETNQNYASPLTAKIVDQWGNSILGAAITFTAGTNATTNATANFSGAATTTVTTTGAPASAVAQPTANGNTGPFTVTISYSGLTPATAYLQTTGPAAALVVSAGGTQSAAVGQAFGTNLQASLQDASGQGVPGEKVVFTVPTSNPNAVMASVTFTTDNSGNVSAPVQAGNIVGSYQVTATNAGFTANFNLTNTAGPAANITGGASLNANVNTAYAPLVAQVTDRFGNPVSAAVSFIMTPAVGGAGATLTSNSVNTDPSNGNATVTANANTYVGAFTVKATTPVGALNAATTFTLNNVAGAPYGIAVKTGDKQTTTVGQNFSAQLVVTVVDQWNNPVSNANVVYYSVPSQGTGASASFTPANPVTDNTGNANVTAVAGTVAGTFTVTASVAGATNPATFTLTSVAATPSQLVLVSGSSQSAAVQSTFAAPLVVEVEDQYGNGTPGSTVNFAPPTAGPGATLSSTNAVSDGNGWVSVNATSLTLAGNFNVVASIQASNSNVTFALTTTAGPVVALVSDPNDGGGLVAKDSQSFAQPLGLTAVDAFGNPVQGAVIDITSPGTGPSAVLSQTQVTTDANGHVQVTATANATSGDYPVTAHVDGSNTPVTAFQLTNSTTSPLAIATVVGTSPQSTAVTTAFGSPIAVQVLDASGNPVSGIVVQFTAPAGGATATLSANANTTDVNGFAEVTAIAGNGAGVYDVVVSVLGSQSSAVVQLTNTPGVPAIIKAGPVSSPQSQQSNDVFGAPLVATVYDAQGNVVPNANVTWSSPSTTPTAVITGAGLQSGVGTTNNNGQSVVTATADSGHGSYTVTATVAGVATPASFTLNNTVTAPITLSLTQGAGQQSPVGVTFASALQFQVRDGTGAAVVGAQVTVTAIGPTSGPSATLTVQGASDAGGNVVVTAVANDVAGTYQVVATVVGGTAPVVLTLVNDAGPAYQITAATASVGQSQLLHHFFGHPLVARVTDAYGNPVVGQAVTFNDPATEPNVILSATTVSTDSSGNVSVLAIAGGRAGAVNTVTAFYGVSSGSASFPLTNLANPNSNFIALLSGGGQTASGQSTFAAPLVFVIYDGSHYAAPGISVNFSTDSNGLSLSASAGITDASGQVQTLPTAKLKTGTFTVTATETDDNATASANLTVTLIPTNTKVASSPEISLGQTLDLNATVAPNTGTATPTGQVRFLADGKVLGTVDVDSHGTASLQTTPPSVGQHQILAQYLPTGAFESSDSDASVLVVQVGWHAVGNSCAQGSTEVWVLAVVGLAMVVWRSVVARRRARVVVRRGSSFR